MCCGAGVPPAFLRGAETSKIAGETPAPRKPGFLDGSMVYDALMRVALRNKA